MKPLGFQSKAMKDLLCQSCKSKNLVHVEYWGTHPKAYDGISEVECKDCGYRIGRWCGQELKKGESENRYCTGEQSHE